MPVKIFIDSLHREQQEKCLYVFDIVRNFERVPGKFFEKMEGTSGLWEVRVEYGGDIFRFLGFFEAGNFLVLAHAFTKKTQKTPVKEIETAEQRKKDHLLRKQK
ncbi:MAG: hypothetical protein A2268_07220 [Candidatus Raymondbacteria bacterium RifOxyA12_full_50_37]|uniref:Addiction module toxin RelE n=1 Tax=Candidatus Raymondbacteria bacterium RIFOXYD12_FULL_49_13 TaxID=1817890 RepID=A0A1F7FEH6_UNCRA|nr:MAG: hypothetical protein A2350_11160 [Candidatus Raymondbacteria bacterium RifOxyB12_full_50_8]OGJ89764.1 MAG: hypothetical protein A2268_07220 [Candidatus Raymondbacteria bacterium RifOxyA12_full_50_37]OGJ91172.1 MAG: hypothetical protein A2248_01365 [Candidatus Raymondbacteria bacterium RIFOXYA2_FULL_49_16]OGJ96305.1 MAG: hypothetical protein A2487_00575 [Candidatus Raymondbacteria bacterium RifOxyC12_full_50_8]OGJ97570.1 MAG: hypothetical protein A2453_02130 [Candidatus Raymondbacteria b